MKRPSLPQFPSLLSAALMSCLALVACKNDAGPGSASIEFILGNDKACTDMGVDVEMMRVVFTRGDSGEELYEEYASCADGVVVIEDVEPNNYDLLVEGLDAAGVVTFDNLGTPASERKLEIFADSQAETTVELTARPADLQVRWELGFGNCMGYGIDRFNIRAFETGGGTLLLEYEIDCETIGEGAEGYRKVLDPDRVLNGTRLGEVGVEPLDASGNLVGTQATFVFDPVGSGYPAQLTLECTDTGCTGTGMLD